MIKLNIVRKRLPVYEKYNNFNKDLFLEKLTLIENTINCISAYIGKRQRQNLINLGFKQVKCYHHNNFLREEMKIKSKEIKVENYDGLVVKIGLAERKYDYNWLEINFDELAKECCNNG